MQREVGRQEVLSAMRARAVMNLHPASGHHGFPQAVPGPRARDDLEVSRGAPIPRHREVRAVSRVRHPLLGGRQVFALHTRPAERAARAWRWRLVQGRIPITRADEAEVTRVVTAQSRGRARAIARIAHQKAVPRWKPAPQARQPPSGEGRWRVRV
jgi:hypothetical protein